MKTALEILKMELYKEEPNWESVHEWLEEERDVFNICIKAMETYAAQFPKSSELSDDSFAQECMIESENHYENDAEMNAFDAGANWARSKLSNLPPQPVKGAEKAFEEFVKEKGIILAEEEKESSFEFFLGGFRSLPVKDAQPQWLDANKQWISCEKEYEVDFGKHCRAKIIIDNGNLKVEAAINGWGDAIPSEEFKIKLFPSPPTNL